MINPDTVPAATARPEYHADFLELSALRSPEQCVSVSDFIRDLNLASTGEVIADSEDQVEISDFHEESEALAEAAFAELDDRRKSCGQVPSQYPFDIRVNTLSLREDFNTSLYTFLALLSWYGKDAGPHGSNGEKLFEEVCAKAAEAYLGGPSDDVRSFLFGFPRRLEPKGFAPALDKLCIQLGEGEGHREGREKLPDQKDGKLDIVAWKEFPDGRQGKLIKFGQCATGQDWDEKVIELPQAIDWCTNWMTDRPSVWPVRSFFVPHRIGSSSWFHTCVHGGILYDRCRIASLAAGLDNELRATCVEWASHVLRIVRET